MWGAGERLAVCGIGAVTLSALLLCGAAPADGVANGPSVPAPFATPRLLAAHLLLGWPLAMLIGYRLARSETMRSIPGGVRLVAAVVLTGLVITASSGLREAMTSVPFGIWASVLRTVIAVSLVAAWFWVGMSLCQVGGDALTAEQRGDVATGDVQWPGPRMRFGVAAAAAFLPPHCYAQAVIQASTEQAATALQRQRLVEAQRWTVRLCELGGSPDIAGRSPQQWVGALREQIQRRQQLLQRPLRPDAAADERLRYGIMLVQLERLSEAETCLQVLCERDLPATLLLATIYRDQGQWEASDRCYRWALSQLESGLGSNSAAIAELAAIYEGLAYNARAAGRPADAQHWLEEGWRRCPDRAARFHLLLGQHFADGGRPQSALEHLQAAVALDPTGSGAEAQKLIASLRQMTPACVLRHPAAR